MIVHGTLLREGKVMYGCCHINCGVVDGGDEHACSELQTASFAG